MPKHPIQPLVTDEHGVIRFKENKIVNYLLDNGGIDLNQIAAMPFSQDDREQFAQLIGYSQSGFGELSYVSDETYNAAEAMRDDPTTASLQARCDVLEQQQSEVRKALNGAVVAAFGTHPDDLYDIVESKLPQQD